MNQSYKIGQNYIPNQPISTPKSVNKENITRNNGSFSSVLEDKLNSISDNKIKFSNHAKERLDTRGIELDSNIIDKLNHAVDKAAQKGSKDSLILIDDLAFVVNVPNKVVVTAVDDKSFKEHIFTNIDSAIIL